MHPASLSIALREAGMTCRTTGGKLLINPVAALAGELREQVIGRRAALIGWLEAADEDDARAEAVAQEAASANPFDDEPGAGFLLRRSVLVRDPKSDAPECVAVDPGFWAWLEEWAASARRTRQAKEAKKQKQKRKKEPKAKE